MESIDEGIKPFEHERLLEFPRSSRLPLVREVGRQGDLVLLQAKDGLGWSLGNVLTRKQVLNSFKLRMETLTLSSPSSTWNRVLASFRTFQTPPQSGRSSLGRGICEPCLSGGCKSPTRQSSKHNKQRQQRENLHQDDDPVSRVVELRAAVDQAHLQVKLLVQVSHFFH